MAGQSPRVKFSFKVWGTASQFATCSGPRFFLNPGAKPRELSAALVPADPSVPTKQKEVV